MQFHKFQIFSVLQSIIFQLNYLIYFKNFQRLIHTLALFLLLPAFAFSQLSFEGIVKDEKTGTELEGALVTVKPLRISGGGYYTGQITREGGTFKTTTNYDYPLQIVVTKKGCKRQMK